MSLIICPICHHVHDVWVEKCEGCGYEAPTEPAAPAENDAEQAQENSISEGPASG